MRTLKMAWGTEGGRLECRWVESRECNKFDADLTRLARSRVSCGRGTRSYVTPARMTNLVTKYKVRRKGAQATNAVRRRSICQSLHRL
jgi:hypothetical protein